MNSHLGERRGRLRNYQVDSQVFRQVRPFRFQRIKPSNADRLRGSVRFVLFADSFLTLDLAWISPLLGAGAFLAGGAEQIGGDVKGHDGEVDFAAWVGGLVEEVGEGGFVLPSEIPLEAGVGAGDVGEGLQDLREGVAAVEDK